MFNRPKSRTIAWSLPRPRCGCDPAGPHHLQQVQDHGLDLGRRRLSDGDHVGPDRPQQPRPMGRDVVRQLRERAGMEACSSPQLSWSGQACRGRHRRTGGGELAGGTS